MYDTLKYYVLRAWSLGLSGADVVQYVVQNSGASETDASYVIDRLVREMSE